MKDYRLIKFAAVVPAIGGVFGSCAETTCSEKSKPNVVVILADDLGYGDISSLNPDGKIKTDNIDRLSRDGVVFTDAHSSSAVSTPSRYSILTGRYNWRSTMKNGVLNGYSKPLIDTSRTTIGTIMQRSGYTTACVGKWHVGWNWAKSGPRESDVDFSKPITCGPIDVGFDYYFGISASLDFPPYVYVENNLATSVPSRIQPLISDDMEYMRSGPIGDDFEPRQVLPTLTQKAVDFIGRSAASGKPFFLYFPMSAPHTPILPTEEFVGKSGLNPYGDFILMVDAMVGRVLDALEDAGVAENTIVMFLSDNGCSPSADYPSLTAKGHNPSWILRGHKADIFEGGHRVPWIVSWPKGYKHHAVSQTVCYTDLFATLASISGAEINTDEGEDSFDLTPLLKRQHYSRQIREATVHHSIDGSFSIRRGNWKLVLSPSSAGWSYPRPGKDDAIISTLPPIQLYDLRKDISEQDNLYDKHPEIVEELTSILIRYIKDGRSTTGPALQNENMGKWPQLKTIPGYYEN